MKTLIIIAFILLGNPLGFSQEQQTRLDNIALNAQSNIHPEFEELSSRYEIYIDSLDSRLSANEKQTEENRIMNTSIKERLNDYFQSLIWTNRIILTIVTIIFAATFALVIKHEYDIKNKAKEQLAECDKLFLEIQNNYKEWIAEVQNTYKSDLELYNHLYTLKFILLQDNPSPEEIYSNLTALSSTPKKDFMPTFDKLLKMNIDEETKKKAREGLEKLKKIQQNQ